MELSTLLAEALQSRGWNVRSGADLGTRFSSFDFVGESDTAVVFLKGLACERLRDVADQLTAEVAAAMSAAKLGAKAWESYLVLAVTGLDASNGEVAQSIQHDLSYCRKIILDSDRILRAAHPKSEAETSIAFLFPLEIAAAPSPINVRQALRSKLIQMGTPTPLAETLVANFDETECRCLERVIAWAQEAARSGLG